MAHSEICCGYYQGTIYLRDKSVADQPLLEVGNADITVSQELAEIEQASRIRRGGVECKVAYTNSVNLDLVLHCINERNLALAFLGDHEDLSGSVSDEEHSAFAVHELIPFEFVPDKTSIVVEDTLGGGGTTYVEGDDYVVTNAGIKIIDGSSIPVDGSPFYVNYDYTNNIRVNAQTVSQKEYELVFDGENIGEDGNRAVVFKAWRVKFNPTEEFIILSGDEEFSSLEVQGEVLRDGTKTSGSQYMEFEFGGLTA